MTFDQDTGELFENGHAPESSISMQAVNGATRAKVESDRMRYAHGESSLHGAIFLALRDIPVWIKAEASGGRNIKYATLKDILAVVRPALAAHGIRIRQGAERSWPADDGGGLKGRLVPVYTDLIHTFSGAIDRTTIEIPLLKMDPQAMGSAITYGKRYSLLAALGLATDEADDDGASAVVKEMGSASPDSAMLLEMKSEMDAIANEEKLTNDKKLEKITKWSMDPKVRARLNRLTDAESERAIQYYTALREQLNEA